MNTYTIYRHLLWKEFRSLSPLVLLSVGIALFFQIVQFTSKKETHLDGIELYLAEAIPVLVAMICIGVSIGYERDNRSWNWFSSIPVSWKHVLSSKAIAVATLVATSAIVLQFSEHALLAWMNKSTSQSVPFLERVLYPSAITCCLVLVMFTSVLLTRQTLSGLMLSLLILGASLAFLPTYAAVLLVVLIAGAGLPLFEWRWKSGQFTDIVQSIFDLFSTQPSATSLTNRGNSVLTMSRPSTTQAIGWQVARQSLPIMVLAVLVCMLIRVAHTYNTTLEFDALLGICMALSAMMVGISTLHADVRQQQFRFLSDRGIPVATGLITRLAIAAVAIALFILGAKQLGNELFVIGLLTFMSVAGIAITNSSIIAITTAVLSSLTYGFAMSYLPMLGTFMRGRRPLEQTTWRVFFDWNPTVHICVFSILILLSAIWLWNVRYRRSDRWLVVRFVLIAPVAFAIASLAAIPTIVYEQKYVDPKILFGQTASPVALYQVDGEKPYGAFSTKAIFISNVYASGKLGEYGFSSDRDLLEANVKRMTTTNKDSPSERGKYFIALQDRVQSIKSVGELPVTEDTPHLSLYTRALRLDGPQYIGLAEMVAAELAEIVFIAVFLDHPEMASMAMDKYLDVIELHEPAFTKHAVAPLSLIRPDEWKKYFSAEQRSRILNLGGQSVQQLMDRQRSLTQWSYKQIESQEIWPWRRAFFQRILLQSFQRDLEAFNVGPQGEHNSTRFAVEVASVPTYNQFLDAIKNDIKSIEN